MNPIEQLESVLCDPEGNCCITGSNSDRQIVNKALVVLRDGSAQQVQPAEGLFIDIIASHGPKFVVETTQSDELK